MSRTTQGRRPLFGPVSVMSYGLDWFRKHQPSSLFSPVDDAQSAGLAHRLNLGVGPDLHFGTVVDVVAYAQCYRVLLDRNAGVLLCTALVQGSLLPVGPRPINAIGPGCPVYVLRHPSSHFGLILGVAPTPMTAAELALSDYIHQASRCGLRVDKVHSAPFQCTHNGTIVDWSDGRPFDGLSVGEWGAITETGLRVVLDSYMVQLAADEATGVFAFYHDQLLRLAGVNTQHFSSGHELEVYLDQDEIHHYDGFTPYPWEQLGVHSPHDETVIERAPRAVQFDEPHYAAWEPADDRRQPFHRSLAFRGYLGQGGRRMVQVPGSGASTYGTITDVDAVFEEGLGLDGSWSVRSAKSVLIAKRVAIPAVHRVRLVEDPGGDNEENYRFAGVAGGGEPHRVTGEIRSTHDLPHLQQVAGVMDLHTWVFNWKGAHPFHYHRKDWALTEESATFVGRDEETIPFGLLLSSFYLPRPSPTLRHVDHRYGEVRYFPNQSYLGMNDDGGVVLGDGCGAEIRMAGGHIFITAPGDVWLKSGRNVNTLAGRDACLRARNSVDLSATNRDVRLKAERNLHMVGGNDGKRGGVLIECKAPSSYGYENVVGEDVFMGGFQVKAAEGDAVIWARDVYVRTGGGDVKSGSITLDADRGRQPIVLQGDTIQNFARDSVVDNFGAYGAVQVSHVWSATGNVIGSGCCVQGSVVLNGGLVAKGWIEAVGGHFASELSSQYHGLVGLLDGESLGEAQQALGACRDSEDDAVAASVEFWRQLFDQFWYAARQAGDDATIDAVHFTFRNHYQYRTDDFRLFEDRWQQLARLTGQRLTAWEERSIVGAAAEETMPYPGRVPWREQSTYLEQDFLLYDATEGRSRERAEAQSDYEDPAFRAPRPVVPNGNYLIIA
jgi:hypothetical protein